MKLPILLIAASSDAAMRYASGLAISDPFILLDTGRKKTVMVSVLEYGMAKAHERPGPVAGVPGARGAYEVLLWDRYYPKRRLKGRASGLATMAAALCKERGIARVRMPMNALAIHVETLRRRGVKVELGELYAERAVKREDEIREIARVGRATVAAMQSVIAVIKKSKIRGDCRLESEEGIVTSESLRREARRVLLGHDCEAQELIISHGSQSAVPHHEGEGPIHAHEPVVLDFFARSMESGYWFDMTRTVCKGEPSPALERQYDAVLAAQRAALKSVKPKASCASLFRAADAELRRRGYATGKEEGFIHSLGHGLGLEIHEAPSLSPRSKERLRPGMVIAIEPGLYYKASGGVRIEDTVLVTRDGCKDLTRLGKVLRL